MLNIVNFPELSNELIDFILNTNMQGVIADPRGLLTESETRKIHLIEEGRKPLISLWDRD